MEEVFVVFVFYAGKILGIKTWAAVLGSVLVVIGNRPLSLLSYDADYFQALARGSRSRRSAFGTPVK
jgi:hypothetical protein